MSEQFYRNLANTPAGYVIAPAGCGKTEAIVRTVKDYCSGKQLILTHTHAGVGALKKRFKSNSVPNEKYHTETISGWALGWVRRYPTLSGYTGSLPVPENNDWIAIYNSAKNLLQLDFVRWVIKNSYSGIMVDEYQDCSIPMHNLISELKTLLPCRVLGDPLQGIFDFNGALVAWDEVQRTFTTQIGELTTPHRWINANNELLGRWLIDSREDFKSDRYPDFTNSPITSESPDIARRNLRIQELGRKMTGSVCIIGPKHNRFQPALLTSLVNIGFKYAEPNELPVANECLAKIAIPSATNGDEAFKFIEIAFAALNSHKDFIKKILKGVTMRPTDPQRKKLYTTHPNGYTHKLFCDTLFFIQTIGIQCKNLESVTCLTEVLTEHLESNMPIMEIFSRKIAIRKLNGSQRPRRCVGTTLLLKGLEFDHSIILFNEGDSAWRNKKDLYVAITRGAKSVRLIR